MSTSNEELRWTIRELEALDYLEVTGYGDEARIKITEKGMVHAKDIMLMRHTLQERVLISLYYIELGREAKEGIDG